MRTFLFVILCFLVLIPVTAFAESDITVEFEGRYWITDLAAKAKVTKEGVGTEVDFKGDLGLKDKNFPEGRFTWYTGPKSKIRLSYLQIDYHGDKVLQQAVEFGGQTYPVDTNVITHLDVKYLRLGWIWQFVNIANGMIKFGTLLEAKGLLVDTKLGAPNISIQESKNIAAGLPTIGVALDINPINMINFFGEISGMTGGQYGYFLDGEAGIKIIPIKNVSILGGYRLLDVKAKHDQDFAKVRLSGPFVGATLRF